MNPNAGKSKEIRVLELIVQLFLRKSIVGLTFKTRKGRATETHSYLTS